MYSYNRGVGFFNKADLAANDAADETVTEEELSPARCPIGLDIGADTPEEIALAICAEILSFERKTR